MKKKIKKICAQLFFFFKIIDLVRFFRVYLLKRPVLTILCYHRITDQLLLLGPACVPPKKFNEQLDFFIRHFDILPLSRVTSYLKGDAHPERDTLVLTFDDGYLDNYENAMPALKKRGIDATFFVAIEPVFENKPYWIDELCVLLENLTKDDLESLYCKDKHLTSLLEKFANEEKNGKEVLTKEIFLNLKIKSGEERKDFFALFAGKEKEDKRDFSLHRVINVDQLNEMVKNGFCIGGHSLTHPSLATLSRNRCVWEIKESIDVLKRHNISVTSFAYPFGNKDDVNNLVRTVLSETDIAVAVTTESRIVKKNDDPLLLPRKVISNQTMDEIASKLELMAWKKI